jgi:hypothetical protein
LELDFPICRHFDTVAAPRELPTLLQDIVTHSNTCKKPITSDVSSEVARTADPSELPAAQGDSLAF